VLSCAEDNISEHFWLFAAGEPLFPSKVWENACIAHAAFLTAAMYYLFGSSNSILGIMWLVLLGVWPLWIVVFLMNGWKTNQIMVAMIIGLAILSPLFLLFLMMWSLGHGGSLG